MSQVLAIGAESLAAGFALPFLPKSRNASDRTLRFIREEQNPIARVIEFRKRVGEEF